MPNCSQWVWFNGRIATPLYIIRQMYTYMYSLIADKMRMHTHMFTRFILTIKFFHVSARNTLYICVATVDNRTDSHINSRKIELCSPVMSETSNSWTLNTHMKSGMRVTLCWNSKQNKTTIELLHSDWKTDVMTENATILIILLTTNDYSKKEEEICRLCIQYPIKLLFIMVNMQLVRSRLPSIAINLNLNDI